MPVGAIARYPFGRLRKSLSQCSLAAFSDSVSYMFNHLCSSRVISYFIPRLSNHSCIPIRPKPRRLFCCLIFSILVVGSSALIKPQTRNFEARCTTSLKSSAVSIFAMLIDPRLQQSESSELVTSVQALRRVSPCLAPKLKLNPGSPVIKACLTFV